MAQENTEKDFNAFKTILGNPIELETPPSEDPAPIVDEVPVVDEEEEIIETPEDHEDPIDDEKSPTEIKVIAQHFAEKGILTGFDQEALADLDDEAAFETAINATVDSRIKEYKESIPEEARYFLEYLEQGGDPRNYAEMMSRPDYSKIDIKDENAQKRVMRDYLSASTRLTPEQIERRIERYIEKDTLTAEAEDALEELKYAQEQERDHLLKSQKERQEAEIKTYEAYKNDLKKNIEQRKDVGGFTITDSQRNQLYDHMIKPVTKDGKTQLMLNAEKDPDIMLKYAFLDMIGWDINKLSKYVETKVTKSLKDKLKSTDTMTKVKGSTTNDKSSNFSAFKSFTKD